jgi:hypothetical protein
VTLFGVDLRRREMAMDLRIGCRFENLKKDIDLRISPRNGNTIQVRFKHVDPVILFFISDYLPIFCIIIIYTMLLNGYMDTV